MFTHYRTEGVILKRTDRGEADQLLAAYTKDFGRLDIVAKGIRKITSKLRPAVEFPSIVELEFIQGKTCKTLTDAVILISLKSVRDDRRKWGVASRIAALVEAMIKDQQKDETVWDLIKSTLAFMETADRKSDDAVYNYFVWHIFGVLGWRPEFGEQSAGIESRSLVCFFRDTDVDRSSRMRLTERQSEALETVAARYMELVTK